MDEAALRDQLAACHEDAFAWAVHCSGLNRGEVEDVLQTAYLKVLDGRARFDGRSAFRTWLFAVIRRTAADHRRWRRLRELRLVPMGSDHVAHAADPAPDRPVHDSERRGLLEGALAKLPERQRQVLLLVFYHGCTVEEAARVMGVAVGSARTHYARGKDRMRALLGEAGWTDDEAAG
jgi:RNA polymerase sigma-70 factor (ECF subfamily)